MTTATMEADFKKKVGEEVRMLAEGQDRFRVFTPFRFGDGDHLAVVLKRDGQRWLLSDEGHTFMRLTYDMDEKDLQHGPRRRFIERALTQFGVTDKDGVLLAEVPEGRYGEALFGYMQAILHITDVSYLSREAVKSTFMTDFMGFLSEISVASPPEFDWHDEDEDPDKKYAVDCRIEGKTKPIFVFGVPNEDKCRDATITIQHYEIEERDFSSLIVFEDQEQMGRKPLARLTDVADKMYSTFGGNQKRIAAYLAKAG
jgi:hypothetical protein